MKKGKKGIGRSMEVGISPRFRPEVVPEEEISLLYSPRRLRIIEYLANRPCAGISDISKGAHMDASSARWHISRMVDNLLLEECAKKRYAPPEMVPYEWTALFVALHNGIEAKVLDNLIKKGSMKVGELGRALGMNRPALSYHLRKLADLGLIHRESGYYTVDFNVLEIQERASKITGSFVANLLLKGRMQGVLMEMENRGHEFIIMVKGKKEMEMRIHEVPFHEILG